MRTVCAACDRPARRQVVSARVLLVLVAVSPDGRAALRAARSLDCERTCPTVMWNSPRSFDVRGSDDVLLDQRARGIVDVTTLPWPRRHE